MSIQNPPFNIIHLKMEPVITNDDKKPHVIFNCTIPSTKPRVEAMLKLAGLLNQKGLQIIFVNT